MSEGWARCGQCSEIFDAASSLQDDSATISGGADIAVDVNIDAPVEVSQGLAIESAADISTSDESLVQLAKPLPNLAAQEAIALKSALQEIVAARQNFTENSEPRKSLGPSDVQQPVNSTSGLSASPQEGGENTGPSFLRESSDSLRRTAWHRSWVRASLTLVSVALTLLFVSQVVVHERDRLATLFPQVKPVLEAACIYLNCTVSTLRQIDAVAVESSTFSKIRNDTYRLSLSIKNAAPYELAMPALELTLTDSQDQTLLRRVLLGSEVNINNRLAANSEWTGAIELSVRSGVGVDRVAGYRVLAFYP